MKFFLFLRKQRSRINTLLVGLFSGIIVNILSDFDYEVAGNLTKSIIILFNPGTLRGIIVCASLFLFLLVNGLYVLVNRHILKQKLSEEFYSTMKEYTASSITDSIGSGCLSWGEGKTVVICNEIMNGWSPENVTVNSFDPVMYSFPKKEEYELLFGKKDYIFNQDDYLAFKNSESFRSVIRSGNNLPRVMLCNSTSNFDKKNRKLLLYLKRTEWSQTSYVWNRFGKKIGKEIAPDLNLMKQYALGVGNNSQSERYLPNSFCLHLIIETSDDKVVLSKISNGKHNDNPNTWAATLGEQLEEYDFYDGNNYYSDFVSRWVRRAFEEEYKLDENNYLDIVDEQSIRVLGVDFESDRYNFSLVCAVRTNYPFSSLNSKVKTTLSTNEAIELKGLNISEIPSVLAQYKDENLRKEYHPSTFIRLLLLYVHRNGYARAEREIRKYIVKNNA